MSFSSMYIVFVKSRFSIATMFFIHLRVKIDIFIQHISDTAAHTGCKILAGLAED